MPSALPSAWRTAWPGGRGVRSCGLEPLVGGRAGHVRGVEPDRELNGGFEEQDEIEINSDDSLTPIFKLPMKRNGEGLAL